MDSPDTKLPLAERGLDAQQNQIAVRDLPRTSRSLRNSLRWAADAAVDMLFPPTCSVCQEEAPSGRLVCASCRGKIVSDLSALCSTCGLPIPKFWTDESACPHCKQHQSRCEKVVCLGPYDGTLSEAIVRMKHVGEQSLTAGLADLLADQIRSALSNETNSEVCRRIPDAVLPIPMHWRRRLTRGVGTSAIMAQRLAANLGIPLLNGRLLNRRLTKKQSTLSVTERKSNVRNAFRLSRRFDPTGGFYLLVDDTLTTGATTDEATRMLLAAGADRVWVAVAARAKPR